VSRTAVGTAPCGLSPTAAVPSALPDSDRSMPVSTAAVVSRISAVGTALRGLSPTAVVPTVPLLGSRLQQRSQRRLALIDRCPS